MAAYWVSVSALSQNMTPSLESIHWLSLRLMVIFLLPHPISSALWNLTQNQKPLPTIRWMMATIPTPSG